MTSEKPRRVSIRLSRETKDRIVALAKERGEHTDDTILWLLTEYGRRP